MKNGEVIHKIKNQIFARNNHLLKNKSYLTRRNSFQIKLFYMDR